MSTLHIFQTIFEILAVGFVIWGILNEQRLVAFEKRIKAAIQRKKLRLIKENEALNRHCA